ncbi:MAG: 4Fe-4S dicluster domain-containing protein [Deltaproteobacteria bacterium]|nr:4Fe-4S dicluster domain-containing protein [Deltaproteobacteria bacterium]
MQIIDRESIEILFKALSTKGFDLIGPTVRNGAIIYDHLDSVSQMPVGWTDRQMAGNYRIVRKDNGALFGYVVGPHSWKNFLYPSIQSLWQAKRNGNSFEIIEEEKKVPKFAFIGVRPCDLKAISVHDRVFLEGDFIEPGYKSRRKGLFIIAVNCTEPGGSCFCASMNCGPSVSGSEPFDLALTEVLEKDRHYFVVQTGSEQGKALMQEIPHRPAGKIEIDTGKALLKQAALSMGRVLDTENIKELLYQNLEHPRWEDTARRCLSCANCTMVCPTCFCSTTEDVTDLTGDHAERRRRWDSCFSLDFSYIHGGYIRATVKARYRQWMTHKLASWMDQFGTSGCVGCGRCITWCPVGIDITEEVQAIRGNTA